MPVGDLTTIHINRALTDMSVWLANKDDQYLVPSICARRPVTAKSDNFFRYGREIARRTPAGVNARVLQSLTGPGSPAPMVVNTVTTGTYACQRYSLRELVTDDEIARSDAPLKPLTDAAAILRQRIMNDLEYLAANIIGANGNYPSGNTLTLTTGGAGTTWNVATAASGSDPLANIRSSRQTLEKIIQLRPNVLACTAATKLNLDDHSQFKNILQYTKDDYLEGEGIPEHIRGLRLKAGFAVGDTSSEGAAYSGDYLFQDWSDGTNKDIAILCYVPEEKTIGVRGFASFIWFDCTDETTGQHGVSLRSYRDDQRRGWWVEAAVTADIQAGIVDSNSKITGAFMIRRTTV